MSGFPVLLFLAQSDEGGGFSDKAIMLALIGLLVALVRVVEHLIAKFGAKKNGKSKDETLKKVCDLLERLAPQIHELHEWHDKDDPNDPGVKVWYMRRSLEVAIKDLSENIEKQTTVIVSSVETLKDIRRDQDVGMDTLKRIEYRLQKVPVKD